MSLDPSKPAYQYPANNNACGDAYNPNMPPSVVEATYCTPSPYFSIDGHRMLSGLMNSVDPMLRTSLGICGSSKYLKGAAATTGVGRFAAIVVINDIILDTANTTEVDSSNVAVDMTPLAGVTIKAGTILNGIFTKVTLLSGVCKVLPLASPL